MKDIDQYLSGDRLKHTFGVLENIELVINEESPMTKVALREAALYHDIRYSHVIARENSHHALDGYLFLKDKMSPLTSYLVLTHTGAEDLIPIERKLEFYKEKKEILFLLREIGWTDEEISRLQSLLNWADMHTSSKGELSSLSKRLLDIENRYGANSKEALSFAKEIARLNTNFSQ